MCSAVHSWLILSTLAIPTSPDSPLLLAFISFLPNSNVYRSCFCLASISTTFAKLLLSVHLMKSIQVASQHLLVVDIIDYLPDLVSFLPGFRNPSFL